MLNLSLITFRADLWFLVREYPAMSLLLGKALRHWPYFRRFIKVSVYSPSEPIPANRKEKDFNGAEYQLMRDSESATTKIHLKEIAWYLACRLNQVGVVRFYERSPSYLWKYNTGKKDWTLDSCHILYTHWDWIVWTSQLIQCHLRWTLESRVGDVFLFRLWLLRFYCVKLPT